MSTHAKFVIGCSIVGCLIAASFIPYPWQTAPQISVEVRNESDEPIVKARVAESFWMPLTDKNAQPIYVCTDGNGKAMLPERKVWQNLFSRIVASFRQIGQFGLKAEFYAAVLVNISAEGYKTEAVTNEFGGIGIPPGEPINQKVLLKKLDQGEKDELGDISCK